MNGAPVSLTISIVHHDGLAMLRECLRSIYVYPPSEPFEIIVVDNVSTDGSRDMLTREFPDVRILRNSERRGFGANHNSAIAEACGEFILLLNDDTIVHPGAVDALVRLLKRRPEVGMTGPRLLNRDGSLQLSCYRFPSPLRSVYESLFLTSLFPDHNIVGDYRRWPHNVERDVEFIGGAVMLARRRALDIVGPFDTNFYMYAEETDLQLRMSRTGWRIAFCPDAEVTHFGGASSADMRDRQFCEFNRSNARYIRKHYGPAGAAVQRVAMVLGSALRLVLSALRAIFRRSGAKRGREYARMLRWWCGLGPNAGIAETAKGG